MGIFGVLFWFINFHVHVFGCCPDFFLAKNPQQKVFKQKWVVSIQFDRRFFSNPPSEKKLGEKAMRGRPFLNTLPVN